MALTVILTIASVADADPPMINYIFPAGGQRGTTVEARIGGCTLNESPSLFWPGVGVVAPNVLRSIETTWFEGPVIPQPASQEREDYPRDYAASLILAADAPLGLQAFRAATSQGVTAGLGFIVGALPEVVEQEEEGNSPPVAVTLPVTINGRIFPREDVDDWSFSASAGQVVTCHVATSVFGSPLRARVAITDMNGRLLAETSPAGDTTPDLAFTVPATGEYRVRIHDVGYKGLQNYVYRLTVTTGPVVDAVYPLGGRRGTATRFELEGANLLDRTTTIALPSTGSEMSFQSDDPLVFSDVRLRVDEFDEFLEVESDDGSDQARRFAVPGILNGRIQKSGEVDAWQFAAQKGREYEFDVYAARGGSPLDAVLAVCDATGRTLHEVDDEPGFQTDARLRWTAPAEGEYQIRIRDRLSTRGGRRFAYRIRVTSATEPDFSLKLPVDFINVERGQTANLKLNIDRGPGFNEPVELQFEGMPAGVTITSPMTVAGNLRELQLTLKADQDAKAVTVPVRVTGVAKVGEREIRRTAVTLTTSSGPDAVSIADPASLLWISIAVPTPFKYVGVFETKYIPRGSVLVRKYRIERNGFQGPLVARFGERQFRHLQGLTASKVFISPDQNEFEFGVQLRSWMEIGRTTRSTILLLGETTDADGTTHQVSFSSMEPHNQMVALIATSRLGMQLSRPTLVATGGASVELPVRLQRSAGLDGPVTLDLVVPQSMRGVSAKSVTVDRQQSNATLVIDFSNEMKGIAVHPVTIRATMLDERNFPVITEEKLTLVEIVDQAPK